MSNEKHSKTEAPTPRRKKEARRKGQVARTPELSAWVSLLAATTVIPTVVHRASHALVGLEAASAAVMVQPDDQGAVQLLGRGLGTGRRAARAAHAMTLGLRRPGVVMIAAIVLWLPTVRQLLAGSVTLDTACVRLLAALALSWVGVGIICRVTAGYRGQVPSRRWDDPRPPDEQAG
jgi:hypothetical protein